MDGPAPSSTPKLEENNGCWRPPVGMPWNHAMMFQYPWYIGSSSNKSCGFPAVPPQQTTQQYSGTMPLPYGMSPAYMGIMAPGTNGYACPYPCCHSAFAHQDRNQQNHSRMGQDYNIKESSNGNGSQPTKDSFSERPSDPSSFLPLSPENKREELVKKEGEKESDPDVIFMEEGLNFSNKQTDGWNESEYCALCFKLLGTWSSCPKYVGYSEKKKHARKHAEEKKSSDWKKELRACFPASSDGGKSTKPENIGKKRKKDSKTTSPRKLKFGKNFCKASSSPPSEQESALHQSVNTQDPNSDKPDKAEITKEDRPRNTIVATSLSDPILPHQRRIQEIIQQNKSAGVTVVKCQECSLGSLCNNTSSLNLHIMAHVDDNQVFACSLCSFKGKYITQHVNRIHIGRHGNTSFILCKPSMSHKLLEVVEACYGHKDDTVSPGLNNQDLTVSTKNESVAMGPKNSSSRRAEKVSRKRKHHQYTARGRKYHFTFEICQFIRKMKEKEVDHTDCLKCKRRLRATSYTSLEGHVYSHSGKKFKECKLCGFSANSGLRPHFDEMHNGVEQSSDNVVDHRMEFDAELVQIFHSCFKDNQTAGTDFAVSERPKDVMASSKRAINEPTGEQSPPKPTNFLRAVNKFMKRTKGAVETATCGKCKKSLSVLYASTHVYRHFGENLKVCRICQHSGFSVKNHFELKHPGKSISKLTVEDRRHVYDSQLTQMFEECFGEKQEN